MDCHQNLMVRYLHHAQSFQKISSKSIHRFSSNKLTNRQTGHRPLPKFNQLFLIAFLTFPEKFIKNPSITFCLQTDRRTDRETDRQMNADENIIFFAKKKKWHPLNISLLDNTAGHSQCLRDLHLNGQIEHPPTRTTGIIKTNGSVNH